MVVLKKRGMGCSLYKPAAFHPLGHFSLSHGKVRWLVDWNIDQEQVYPKFPAHGLPERKQLRLSLVGERAGLDMGLRVRSDEREQAENRDIEE